MPSRAQTTLDLRRIAYPANAAFWELLKQPDFWKDEPSDRALHVAIIEELGRSGEPGLLRFLTIGCAMHPNPEVRAASRQAITNVLSLVPLAQLRALDAIMRESVNYWDPQPDTWSGLQPSDVRMFRDSQDFGVLALATMHRNGRVREAALLELATLSTGQELPFLLLRINDWAIPVRERARELVSGKLLPEYAAEFVRCIPLIQQIRKGSRADHAWLIAGLESLFAKSSDALREGCASEDREIRRWSLQTAIRAQVPWLQTALRAALRDSDTLMRHTATTALLSRADDTSLANELLRDGFMPIRRDALRALVDAGAGNAKPALIKALLDRHGSIRELARFHLRGTVNPVEHYQAALPSLSGSRRAIAIRGLAECGGSVSVIAEFLSAPEICVRRAAISAVGRLDGRRYEDALFAALADSSPGVSKEATLALARRGQELDGSRLHALLAHPSALVRSNVLRLATSLPKWSRLPTLLAACRDDNADIAAFAMDALKRWLSRYNLSFVTPTRDQVQNAVKELEQSHGRISPGTLRELEALLGSFR